MAEKHSFNAVIQNAGGGGAFVEVPFDVEKAFGSKRPKVKATIDGIPYRGTLVRMGSECAPAADPQIHTRTGRQNIRR